MSIAVKFPDFFLLYKLQFHFFHPCIQIFCYKRPVNILLMYGIYQFFYIFRSSRKSSLIAGDGAKLVHPCFLNFCRAKPVCKLYGLFRIISSLQNCNLLCYVRYSNFRRHDLEIGTSLFFILENAASPHLTDRPASINNRCFVLEPHVQTLEDLGWEYLDEKLTISLTDDLRAAIDPAPFGRRALEEDRGCFTSRGYLFPTDDPWQHDRPQAKQADRKPSIRERLEQSKQECRNKNKAQAPRKGKSEPEL